MILLDTHILIWSLTRDTRRMSDSAFAAVDRAVSRHEAVVSAVTFWEWEHSRRRDDSPLRQLPPTLMVRREAMARGLLEIPPTGDIMAASVMLADDGFHADPMDRIIVATAIQHGCPLVTVDAAIRQWAGRTGNVELADLS